MDTGNYPSITPMAGALLNILTDNEFPVNGRELHQSLEIATAYKDWFPRMCEYGFEEGRDFNVLKNERVQNEGGRLVTREVIDHQLTIGMAKELCMIQRNEKGREVRRYLIEIENQWNTPEAVMSRALQMANKKLAEINRFALHLQADNSRLAVENTIMQPKAEYFDELVDRAVNVNLRDTAKLLNIREREFIDFLKQHKYLYRDHKGKLVPYAQYVNDLFVVKECFNEKTNWAGTQTLVTPKGRETFRILIEGLR